MNSHSKLREIAISFILCTSLANALDSQLGFYSDPASAGTSDPDAIFGWDGTDQELVIKTSPSSNGIDDLRLKTIVFSEDGGFIRHSKFVLMPGSDVDFQSSLLEGSTESATIGINVWKNETGTDLLPYAGLQIHRGDLRVSSFEDVEQQVEKTYSRTSPYSVENVLFENSQVRFGTKMGSVGNSIQDGMHILVGAQEKVDGKWVAHSNGHVTEITDASVKTKSIQATEVVVTPRWQIASAPPDYVFEPDYNLENLEDVAKYIKNNRHLKDVPSAKEFVKKGVNMVEMNMTLLKKVEELTLYAIDQEKRIKSLEKTLNVMVNEGGQ